MLLSGLEGRYRIDETPSALDRKPYSCFRAGEVMPRVSVFLRSWW